MEPDLPVSARPAILRCPCRVRWKVALGSPGPMFYGTFGGPENSPQGGRSALVGPPGVVRPGGSGHKNSRFVEAKRTFSQKRSVELTFWSPCPEGRTRPRDCASHMESPFWPGIVDGLTRNRRLAWDRRQPDTELPFWPWIVESNTESPFWLGIVESQGEWPFWPWIAGSLARNGRSGLGSPRVSHRIAVLAWDRRESCTESHSGLGPLRVSRGIASLALGS